MSETSTIDALLAGNARYADERHDAAAPATPRRRLAVVTCMDARVLAHEALGLRAGDVHVLRNAGGRVTDDALRSLAVSCAVFGTTDVAVIHHTECGMASAPDDLRARIAQATGREAQDLDLHTITEPAAALREDVERLRASPLLPDHVRCWGLRFAVDTGRVTLEQPHH